jgi:NAD+ synthase (glutamine-hydrolysing)
MSKRLRLVMAQINLCVGDIMGNTARVIETAYRARDELGGDAVIFPELTLTSYPPEDLLLRPDLYLRVEQALETLKAQVVGIDLIVGYPRRWKSRVYNAASLVRDGEIIATYHKHHLPNYGVFDEKRYFTPGEAPCVVDIQGVPVGITICEDVWAQGPVRWTAQADARLLVNLNASPFHVGKYLEREEVLRQRQQEAALPMVYVNLVGGQDELVFDGCSFVMDAEGKVTQRAPAFEEGLYPVDLAIEDAVMPLPGDLYIPKSDEDSIYQALVTGVHDYVEKNRFPGIVLGLSGGIDSALTLTVAVDALGPERVQAVMMPSRYTSFMSLEDAQAMTRALGVTYSIIPIEPAFQAFLSVLAEEFAGLPRDATEENIQARCRGVLLMAISNKKHRLVLTTGNKSEMAVGYATLYGDMAGGFAPLKDVFKTWVYRLAAYRNRGAPAIPERVITRAPSAELAPGQKDEDTLPPYPVLDLILEMYIEQDRSDREIVAAGFEEKVVQRVIGMVDFNEYKRRQAPPGIRISQRAFGRDRRYPITSGYR